MRQTLRHADRHADQHAIRHSIRHAWFGAFSVARSAAVVALMGLGPLPLAAGNDPVVVELFTAQGCPVCPPADAFFKDLALRDDLITLALHVDYWDYMGWTDTFGSPDHTARQRGYAKTDGHDMVYTPQMIINGSDYAVGSHRADVTDLIDRHLARRTGDITVETVQTGGIVQISARASRPRETPLAVQRVHFKPQQTVIIERGENAGRIATYVNIVTAIEHIADWDTQAPLLLEIDAAGDGGRSVILLQTGYHGPIVAAVRLPENTRDGR